MSVLQRLLPEQFLRALDVTPGNHAQFDCNHEFNDHHSRISHFYVGVIFPNNMQERRRARKEADGSRKDAASPVSAGPADAAAEEDERQIQQDLLSEQIRCDSALECQAHFSPGSAEHKQWLRTS